MTDHMSRVDPPRPFDLTELEAARELRDYLGQRTDNPIAALWYWRLRLAQTPEEEILVAEEIKRSVGRLIGALKAVAGAFVRAGLLEDVNAGERPSS